MNSGLGDNLEDQRFALRDRGLECRRSAPQPDAVRNMIRSVALPPAVPPAAYRALGAHWDILRQDLGPFCSTVCGTRVLRICTPGRTPAVPSSNNLNTASPAALDSCLHRALFAASPALCARGPSYFSPAATCRNCVERLRTGPLRCSAAHVSTHERRLAVCATMRRRVRHAATCRPLGLNRTANKRNTHTF